MSYRVELTERAYHDIDRIMTWLATWSPGAEDRFSASLFDSLPRLESNPFECGLAYENSESPETLRHLLFETRRGRVYRALFIVREDIVKILTIQSPGERPVPPDELIFPT